MINIDQKQIFEDAFLKWDFIVKHWETLKNLDVWKKADFISKHLPFLNKYACQCSFCSAYKAGHCAKCPLRIKTKKDCFHEKSLYRRAWFNNELIAAIKLRNVIEKMKNKILLGIENNL